MCNCTRYTDPWDYVAFTNIVKCTNVSGDSKKGTSDKTTKNMVHSCVQNNGIIFKEIEELKPTCIVFFSYDLYREFLIELPFAKEVEELSGIDSRVSCGKKTIGWWHRRIKTDWSDKVSILVTHHPERKKKADYVRLISTWVKEETEKV